MTLPVAAAVMGGTMGRRSAAVVEEKEWLW